MNRRIMIVSSDKTGHGHESIVQALKEQFTEQQMQEIRVVNGFCKGGPIGHLTEKLYFPIVKYAPQLWKLIFQFTSDYPVITDCITAFFIRRGFIREVRNFRPDVIVTVHPAFVGSINNLLDRYYLDIPVIVVVADLVNISGIWADYRSSCILVPTEEAKTRLLNFGADRDKVKVFGFPVRKRFSYMAKEAESSGRLKLLVFANAFGRRKTVTIVKNLLSSFDCTVTLLTGRDESLRNYIKSKLADKSEGRLILPGYVVNMEHYMQTCDLLISKAGPNTVMEAVHCSIPIIITGNLPGQEEGTTEWILSQGMGLSNNGARGLTDTISRLLADDRALLKEISGKQRNYKNRNAACDMARFITEFEAGSSVYSEAPCVEELGAL